ncbi:hypothetical protein V8C42DRAFT_336645 [Trichoderma barbatum]
MGNLSGSKPRWVKSARSSVRLQLFIYNSAFFPSRSATKKAFTTSFNIQPLPTSFDFSSALKSPVFIKGRGQKVYWQNCWIKVYDKGQTEQPREWYDVCDGWVILLDDRDVGFGGEGGNIRET